MIVSQDHMTLFVPHSSVQAKVHDFYNDFNFAKTIIRFVLCYHLHVMPLPVAVSKPQTSKSAVYHH